MKVSVVLCTYSLEMYDHFSEAAHSVLSQTYDDVELVIVIDGTPAVYERVASDFDDYDETVLHLNDENVGLLESRNTGAELASGDVVAFIDDDAVAHENWITELVQTYEKHDGLAAGGKMTPEWVAGKPSFLPEEFYWLIGVTHRGFASGETEVRNTFGSNLSFKRDVFLELSGFDSDIGGRKGDKNLQGGETELCARLQENYDEAVWYNPDAKVKHKIFGYRTKPGWLLERAFWQGYSKRAMETLVPDSSGQETDFLRDLVGKYIPKRIKGLVTAPSLSGLTQLLMLFLLTGTVGFGYVYGMLKW